MATAGWAAHMVSFAPTRPGLGSKGGIRSRRLAAAAQGTSATAGLAHAEARGARILGEIVGYGTSCDHSHLVRPEAAGQVRALKDTLADARLTPDDIDYVNAHGTATSEGDPVEIAALKQVFGDSAARLPVSGTKSMHGHLLGAAGAIEAITTVLALHEQCIPPTAHLETLDPACIGVDHVTVARRQPLRAALSNSFAFGGSNAVLAFRAVTP